MFVRSYYNAKLMTVYYKRPLNKNRKINNFFIRYLSTKTRDNEDTYLQR